jgi:uncharacterized membrane protein
VGSSFFFSGPLATEWSGGSVINLSGEVPGSKHPKSSLGLGINDAGQIVGFTGAGVGVKGDSATEWSDGNVINLGGLPGSTQSVAYGINDVGQVVGYSGTPIEPPPPPPPPMTAPEPSTWAMILIGFAGLGYARHRARRSALAA